MNNDRFKFRVWDKKEKCYQQEDSDICEITHEGELVCIFWGDGDTVSTQEITNNDVIIEQCTGIPDRNGKLIFEGDIVRYLSRGIEFEGVVVWWTGTPDGNENFGGWSIEITKNEKWAHLDCWRHWKTFEVIGNIHEVGQ